MKHLLLIFIFLSSFHLQAQEISDVLDEVLSSVPADAPGVAIGIYKNGELFQFGARGLADVGHKIPISTTTNFNIASISKQFTAACIMNLRQNGLLELNDPLSKHIPTFTGELENITLQQLLNHTSGIRDYMSLLMLKQSPNMDFFNNFTGDNQHLYDLLTAQTSVEFQSGSEHRYSNSNYWILGEVVKAVSGKSLGEYAKENIFSPLKMKHTSFQENANRIISNRAKGHICECPTCEIFEYSYRSEIVGDAGLWTNINDLLKWENEYYNQDVLSDDSWKLMTTRGKLNHGTEINYAAGLIVEDYKGYQVIQHSGQEPGFVSMLLKIPSLEISIAVLANYTWVDQASIAYRIADHFLPSENGEIVANQSPSTKPPTINLTTAEKIKFCGTYLFKETGEIREVKLHNDTLFYIRSNGPSSVLVPIAKNTLAFSDRPGVDMIFTFSPDGTTILWQHPIGDMNASSFEPIILTDEEIVAYQGDYYNAELGLTFPIISSQHGLSVGVLGQNIPLTPIGHEQFVGSHGFKVRFNTVDNESQKTLIVDAPRASNILCKRTNL